MKFNIALGGILFAGVIVAALGLQGVGSAQVNTSLFRGAGHAGTVSERAFRFKTIKKNAGVIHTERHRLVVPVSYGKPFTVTTFGTDSIIWYRADDGTVRNVVIGQGNVLVETSTQVPIRK